MLDTEHTGAQQGEIPSKPVPAFPVSPVLCLDRTGQRAAAESHWPALVPVLCFRKYLPSPS